ncbi:hypothetical protein ACIQXD_32095 [Streptomyces uncialis]|uniref:hypothetical protein n=1 Tax=Streptomyces uncialis TaxID=1048205 RepID=UPI003807235F
MTEPHILIPGKRVSLAMPNRDHLSDYHRWENDPGTILGFGTQVPQSGPLVTWLVTPQPGKAKNPT